MFFPETPPIGVTAKHVKFLGYSLAYKPVLQKKIGQGTGLSSKDVTLVKKDFLRLGWCKDIQLGSGVEVGIMSQKEDEIKAFLSQCKLLEKILFVRPHNIKVDCVYHAERYAVEKVVSKLSKDYHVCMSLMMNNKKYVVETEIGKIVFHEKGNLLSFIISNFCLVIRKEDLKFLEAYTQEGIESRLRQLCSIIKECFGKCRISLSNVMVLKDLEIGIPVYKELSKLLELQNKLLIDKVFCDKSIYNCDEFEAKGSLSDIIPIVQDVALRIFNELNDPKTLKNV